MRSPQVEIPSDGEFSLLLDAFLARYCENTRRSYATDLNLFFNWCHEHGGIHPFEARRRSIEAFTRYLLDARNNSASTVNRRVISMRQFYEYAVDDEYIPMNPCRNVKIKRAPRDLTRKLHLTREETQVFLRHAYNSTQSEYAMCCLMAYLGMRVSEVCSLNVANVTEYSRGHRIISFVGKGGYPAVLPQPPVVMRALDALIDGAEPDSALFVRRDGSRMTRRSADRVVKRIAKLANLDAMTISCHTLRHGFISNLITAGVPLRDVQIAARHRDISTTVNIYDTGRFDLDTHGAHSFAAYMGSVG